MKARVMAFTQAVLAAAFLLLPRSLPAQLLSLGVKGGVPFTDAVEGSSGNRSEARRYTVGPMVEVALPFSLAIEFNALYKRTGYRTSDSFLGLVSTGRVRANSWEFPLLLKYYLPGRGGRPYVAGGYVVRHLSGIADVARTFGQDFNGAPVDRSFQVSGCAPYICNDPTHGVALGGGLRFRAGRLRVAPEVRYTRWTGRAFNDQGSRGFFVQSLQNQAEVLLGLSF